MYTKSLLLINSGPTIKFAVSHSAILKDANVLYMTLCLSFVMSYYIRVARTLDTVLRFLCSGREEKWIILAIPQNMDPGATGYFKILFFLSIYVYYSFKWLIGC